MPLRSICLPLVLLAGASGAAAQATEGATDSPSGKLLAASQRRRVDQSVDRALAWLISQQQADGSFRAIPQAQPGVTALCVQALLIRGHQPGQGPYGGRMTSAVRFVVSCQKPNGLLALAPSDYRRGQRYPHGRIRKPGTRSLARFNFYAAKAGSYSHGLAGTVLCEVYGMVDAETSRRVRTAIDKALAYTRALQLIRKRYRHDLGGWRYVRRISLSADSDLCITANQLMFLRAAKNAGFHVAAEQIDEAMAFVKRCYQHRSGAFIYYARPRMSRRPSLATAGSGILAMAFAGRHDTPMARSSGQWLLRSSIDRYNAAEFYHYGACYSSQAMFQLGGQFWRRFYPRLVRTLTANQSRRGSWRPENITATMWGNVSTTALAAQALAVPYQLLPIYQR